MPTPLDIILAGDQRSDETLYLLLHNQLAPQLRSRFQAYRHQLLDPFDDLLEDYFLYLRDGTPTNPSSTPSPTSPPPPGRPAGRSSGRPPQPPTPEQPSGRQPQPPTNQPLPYQALRSIRNPDSLEPWLVITFRNYLSLRAAREARLVPQPLDPLERQPPADNDNPLPAPLLDEQKLALASHLIAYAHQTLAPRDAFILLRSLLSLLDRQRALPTDLMANALGISPVAYRVANHRVQRHLAHLRTLLLRGSNLPLDPPHRLMAQRINDDFIHLYPTLLAFYSQTLDSLSTAQAIRLLRQQHTDPSGNQLHEPDTPYVLTHTIATLWNLIDEYLSTQK